MEYILPKQLKKGDTIGVVSLSGVIEDHERIACGVKKLEELGFKVRLSEHVFDKSRYLAGSDEDKVSELHKFFQDPEIDCVLCSRGGYGAIRILDKIDYSIIHSNPKPFCGYSDITAFSAMFLKHAGLVTYSSPMLKGDFGAEELSSFTIENFLNALAGKELSFAIEGNINCSIEGIAWGGNLTTLATLCGRDFVPEEGFIFIIEDVNEPCYKIDRAFAQLLSSPEFRKNILGVIAGDFTGAQTEEIGLVIKEYCEELKIPAWSGLKLGHERDKVTIPIGEKSFVTNNKLIFKRNA